MSSQGSARLPSTATFHVDWRIHVSANGRGRHIDNGPDYFSDGLARYKENGKYGFFNTAGAVVIPAQFEFAFPFSKGKAKVGEGCTFIPEGEHTRTQCRSWRDIEARPGK